MLTRNICFIPLLFTVDSYVDKKHLLYSIVVYSWQLCWQEMSALFHCCLQLTVMLTRNICFIPLLFTVDSYVDKKCLLYSIYSIVVYSWAMLTRNIYVMPLLFTVDSYVDKKCLLYSIVVYSWQLCWQEISALFHCCLQMTVMLTRNVCFIPLLFTDDSYVDKKYLLYSIVAYRWQLCGQEISALFHCCLQLTVMLTRNICFIPLLFTVDSYVDKKYLLYSIVVYCWQLCWQEISALFHCCLQLTVMLTRNVCFIPLLFTVDRYVDKKYLLYSIVVYSWQLCWQEMSALFHLFHCCLQLSYVDKKYLCYALAVYSWQLCGQEMSALFHCCLQLTVMLTRNICFIPLLLTDDSYVDKKCLLYSIVVYSWVMLTRNICFIPLLFTVDSYVDKKYLLYSIVVYSWQLCWQEISALFHCCLQLTVMWTRNICFIPLLFIVDSYVDKKYLLYSIVVYSWQLCWQEISALFHCCLQMTVMLTRNVCFIPLLFTVELCWQEISALFHCCLQLTVMWTRNICFIPLLFTVDSYVDKKYLLYSIVVYSWQLCGQEISALFHCCLLLTVMLTRNICFIPLLFTVDSYVDKKCLLYSIVVYSWPLCWQEISALFHCCLQLTVMLTRNVCFIPFIPLLFTVELCWQEISMLCPCCLQLTVMWTRNVCFIPLLFTVDSYVDKKYLLYSIVAYRWQLCWQEMSALFHCCLQLSYVDKKYLLYSIVVYSWQLCGQEISALFHCCLQLTVMLTRNICFIPLLFTVDSYVDKKYLLYSIVVYCWQLCWQEISALFHCCLQLTVMLTRNVCFIPLLFTVDRYVDKKYLLYSIVVYSWQLCWQEMSALFHLFHCCLQLSYVDKKYLCYALAVYSWQLCGQEISALFHCCLQLTVMLPINICFIPLLLTVEICGQEISALFHCCLQLTVMLTRNICFIPLLFTVDRYVDKKYLLYSIVVYSWQLCWQEMSALFHLFHCCLQLSYVDKKYLCYALAVYSWQLCWQEMSALFHCCL